MKTFILLALTALPLPPDARRTPLIEVVKRFGTRLRP
jgi:hypothetical protein